MPHYAFYWKSFFFAPFKIKLTQFHCAEQINENIEEHNELSLNIAWTNWSKWTNAEGTEWESERIIKQLLFIFLCYNSSKCGTWHAITSLDEENEFIYKSSIEYASAISHNDRYEKIYNVYLICSLAHNFHHKTFKRLQKITNGASQIKHSHAVAFNSMNALNMNMNINVLKNYILWVKTNGSNNYAVSLIIYIYIKQLIQAIFSVHLYWNRQFYTRSSSSNGTGVWIWSIHVYISDETHYTRAFSISFFFILTRSLPLSVSISVFTMLKCRFIDLYFMIFIFE